ncbi:hypothetical protein PGTUg99_036220 [Puccinia graminis f. sp. tritici]|uniref:Uncharacterized protein n=1 Tax=Puccinia graminis f. sp. tritici TaxID=56615 RepID=A0A5B0R9G8_PUCGR|nr:hypothetical protein PGTUg99_036220 [Puccinia graminis f. sp. tritici]
MRSPQSAAEDVDRSSRSSAHNLQVVLDFDLGDLGPLYWPRNPCVECARAPSRVLRSDPGVQLPWALEIGSQTTQAINLSPDAMKLIACDYSSQDAWPEMSPYCRILSSMPKPSPKPIPTPIPLPDGIGSTLQYSSAHLSRIDECSARAVVSSLLVDPEDATEAESDADSIADTGVDPSKIAQTPAFVFVFTLSVDVFP